MSKKEKLKLLKEMEERLANLRAHVFYGYNMEGQSLNVARIKELSNQLADVVAVENIKTN